MSITSIISDFSHRYWWVLLIIAGLLLFWFWTKLDLSTRRRLQRIFSIRVIAIIVFFASWYFWNRYGGLTTTSSAHRWMPIFALIVMAGLNYMGKLRYDTQQIICANGFHGSYSKPPKLINGFLIFALDSFNAGGLAWDFASRVLVVKEETTELFNEGAVSLASPTQVDIHDLDMDVKSIIENDRFLKSTLEAKPVFYGWFDDINEVDWTPEQLKQLEKNKNSDSYDAEIYNFLKKELGISNPSIIDLFRRYRNVCADYNKLLENFKRVIKGEDRLADFSKRQKDIWGERQYRERGTEGYEEV